MKSITGNKYGRLTVIKEYRNKDNILMCKCKCDCGNITNVKRCNLLSKRTI